MNRRLPLGGVAGWYFERRVATALPSYCDPSRVGAFAVDPDDLAAARSVGQSVDSHSRPSASKFVPQHTAIKCKSRGERSSMRAAKYGVPCRVDQGCAVLC